MILSVISIDYTPAIEQSAGIGRYVRELIGSLSHSDSVTDYRLFVSGSTLSDLPPVLNSNFTWKTTRLSPKWLARIWHRVGIPLRAETFVGDVDLFHATDFVLPPLRTGTRSILTVHDLSFVRVPDSAAPRLKTYLEAVVPDSVRRASYILADSEATRQDLMSLYDVSSDRVSVLLSGVDLSIQSSVLFTVLTMRNTYNLPERPYILSVGTVQPRKNYVRLMQAVRQLRDRAIDVDLVIAGGKGWLEDPIYAAIEEHGMVGHVHFTGFVDDAHLPSLYKYAACFALPSLYEGFGLPVLEAMACGIPVVTSNISSLPEVAGDAALTVDPYDVEVLADALRRLLEDTELRNTLIERGLQRVQNFTWERSAQQLRQVYERVLEMPVRR